MRRTVEPPPISRCDQCGGQLTLKRIDAAHSALASRANIFACTGCGRERSFLVFDDRGPARSGGGPERRMRA